MKLWLITVCALLITGQLTAMNKEVEFKIQLNDSNKATLEQWLSKNAVYKGAVDHCEYYVTNPQHSFWIFSAGYKDTLETVRVRLTQKGDSVCYKYRHIDPVTQKTSHRDEYETKVADGKIVIAILEKLGYSEQTILKKTRKIYDYEQFELTLDDVVDIGQFVEIEIKTAVNDVQAGLQSIKELLQAIGISEYTQFDRSYIHMAWNPGYNFGTLVRM